ncbi:MAG: lysophospholipid acyltransferase family protein [Muribaculaceae bacterium]|nr:lysophospholipid acyltransferase family protein [Muribaculaceae bacterium]MCM1293831.1 lysophospholipid acyltransferase family protein [Bacteroides sp.]
MSYHLLYYTLKLISLIPFRLLYVISDMLYLIVYYIIRYRQDIVRRNLTESFPEKDLGEIVKIEKKFYKYFTDNILESCKMASMSAEDFNRRMDFSNIEKVNEVLRSGKSIGIYLGHYGNWEWVSSMPLRLDKSAVAAQIYHKLRNKNMDRLMLKLRGRMGAVSVDMYKTARYITDLHASHQECIIGFIADQSPKKREVRNFISFLHHRTPVLTGPEKIIKHYGFEAWFLKINRVKRGYYRAEYVKMSEEPSSLPDFELTEVYYRMLEHEISRAPELYLWTHKRFKHATVEE